MEYEVIRTDTADAGIRKIIFYIAQNFGNEVALEQLDYIEKKILELGNDPYIGTDPRYLVLKRQGYKVLILKKDLVFYKINEEKKTVIVYAVVDGRQDYLNIIRGLQKVRKFSGQKLRMNLKVPSYNYLSGFPIHTKYEDNSRRGFFV